MGDSEATTREALSNDREIFADLGVLPVHVHVDYVFGAGNQVQVHANFSMCELTVKAFRHVVYCDVVASGLVRVSFLSLSYALLWISALIPGHCLYVHFLTDA